MANETLQTFMDSFLAADTLLAARQALGLQIGVDVKAEGSAPAAHGHVIGDVTGLQAALDAAGGGDPASETVAGIVEFATQAEVDAADGTTTDQVMRAKHSRILWTGGVTDDSLKIGNLAGNALGEGAINIQTGRSLDTRVASGINSVVIGHDTGAESDKSVVIGSGSYVSSYVTAGVSIGQDNALNLSATGYGISIGYNNTVAGKNNVVIGSFADIGYGDDNNVAIGHGLYNSAQWTDYNTILGAFAGSGGGYNTLIGGQAKGDDNAVAIGYGAGSVVYDFFVSIGGQADASSDSVVIGYASTVTAEDNVVIGYDADADQEAVAIGHSAKAGGWNSGAIGANVQTTPDRIMEIGVWTDTNTRKAAIRIDGGNVPGQEVVGITYAGQYASIADGGATAGSETAQKLARGMYTIRKNSSDGITLYVNDAGTIKSLSLGTVT